MAGPATFPVSVEGIGEFVFRRRNFRLQLQVEGAADRVTGGPVKDEGLAAFGHHVATLEVLTVDAPKGWDLDELDPLDPESFGKVQRVFRGLRDAELRFRAGA